MGCAGVHCYPMNKYLHCATFLTVEIGEWHIQICIGSHENNARKEGGRSYNWCLWL